MINRRRAPNGINKEEKLEERKRNRAEADSDSDDEDAKTIIVVGAPGVGKSNFCNMMIDGRQSGRFLSNKQSVGGVTKNLEVVMNNALNNPRNPKVRVVDMPRLGDPDLPLSGFVSEIKQKLAKNNKVDICLIVTRSTDYRLSL